MTESLLTSYEDIPYESKPLYPTHPDCLATIATLFGMRPAPPAGCRVLELGCATGGNLLPMAELLPESRFLGLDLSPRQIASGQAIVDALGLKNLELRAQSILEVDESLGQFDYIICHGVYSWVPPEVQAKILEICRANLAPQGVAYISYNTYPGWHGRGMIRDMMGYHVRQFDEPQVRVQQARAFAEFIARSAAEPESGYARVLNEQVESLRPEQDYYVFHEHLEDFNQPLYFHQFAARAAAAGLQYLGEAWFHTNLGNFPPEVQETLQAISGDLIHLEQYIDYLTNRTFRRTLLCHAGVNIDRKPSLETIARLHVSALARPVSENPHLAAEAVEEFRTDEGLGVSTNIPEVKAALATLYAAWPSTLSLGQLWAQVQSRLALAGIDVPPAGPARLAEALLHCYLSKMAAFHVQPAQFVRRAGERPLASPLARHYSTGAGLVPNRRHRLVELSAADRYVLNLLNGRRDRAALVEELKRALAAKIIVLGDAPASDNTAGAGDRLDAWLDESLERLAQSAVLVG